MSFWSESDYLCKPLTSLIDIRKFLNEPPIWRTLCKPLTPHSKKAIKNCDVDPNFQDITLETPLTYCHFEPSQTKDKSIDRDTLYNERELPKLLVCHDMANGYHDDGNINGTNNFSAYTFYNWAAVDIFCYFSHHLVTVPPLGWINVAHAHGVKVIGTFITEWADGVAFWNMIFSEENAIENLVSSLVVIAKILKFEGWLINVENKISEPDKLLKFMRNLHQTLHQEIPGAELIWYDSVTRTGQLSWQNRLNELNRPFFDACDGIFTNYSWSEGDVAASAKAASTRLTDVYVGIDVWGRNFYGGGMFNTQEAVKLVYKYGCSMAVFAPAWTHEAMGEEDNSYDPNSVYMGEILLKHERFMIRDRALWDSLWPFFKTKLPCILPFQTSFCRGLGIKRRRCGEVFTNSPWYNLRHMQYQPNCAHGPHGYLLSTDENIKMSHLYAKNSSHKGILKYRLSLIQITETHEVKNKDNMMTMSDEPKSTIDDNKVSDEDKAISGESKNTNDDDKMFKDEALTSKQNEISDEDKAISGESKNTNDNSKMFKDEAMTSKQNEISDEDKVISGESKNTNDDSKMFKDEAMTSKQHEISDEDKVISGESKNTNDDSKMFKDEAMTSKQNEISNDKKTTSDEEKGKDKQQDEDENEIIGKFLSYQSSTTMLDESKLKSTLRKIFRLKKKRKKRSEDGDKVVSKQEQPELSQRESQDMVMFLTEQNTIRVLSSGRSMTQGVSFQLKHSKTRYTIAYVNNEKECLQPWLEDSFNGGTCLKVNPTDEVSGDYRVIRLLRCDFLIKASDMLVVCLVTKVLPESCSQWLNLWLYVTTNDSTEYIELVGRTQNQVRRVSWFPDRSCYPLDVTSDEFAELRTYLVVHEPEFYLVPENLFGWNIFYYQVPWQEDVRVSSINLRTGKPDESILLGHVGLCTKKQKLKNDDTAAAGL